MAELTNAFEKDGDDRAESIAAVNAKHVTAKLGTMVKRTGMKPKAGSSQ